MRNNEGEFKALLATGGCSSLLTLFLLLLPHSFWVCLVFLNPNVFFNLSPLVFWLMSLVMKAKRKLSRSCFLVWYALFLLSAVCSLHLLLYFLISPVPFFSIFEDVNTFDLNGEKLNCKTSKNGVLPELNPMGQSILSETRTCRSTQFHPACSICGLRPQSDQYMNMRGPKQTNVIISIMDRSSGSQPFCTP